MPAEWEEGHTDSGKWESRRQVDIIAVVKSVKSAKDTAEPTCKIFHSILLVTHMQPDKVWKAVSVYEFIFPVVSFPPTPTFKFSAEIRYIKVIVNMGWRASEKLNVFTEKKGAHSHTIKLTVTKLCRHLGDGKTSN